MTWLDIVVIVVWAMAAVWGLKTGLVGLLFPLIIVIAGLLLGSVAAGPIGDWFAPLTDSEPAQKAAAYAVIFVVLLVAGSLGMRLLSVGSHFLPASGLANMLAGGIVGLVAGFMLLSGALAGVQKLPSDYAHQLVSDSGLSSNLAENFSLVARATGLIPGDWSRLYQDARDSVEELLE